MGLIVQQQLIIMMQREHDAYEKARLKYQEIVELDERKRDNRLLEMKFKQVGYFELWQNLGLLWGGALCFFLFGSFVGHNALSQR